MGLERVVQLHLGGKLPIHHHGALRERLVHFSFFLDFRLAEIGRIREHRGRARLHGFNRIHHERLRRGLHLDQPQGIETSLLAGSGHRRQFLAIKVNRPFAITHRHGSFDARNRPGLFQIDGLNESGGPFRTKNHAVKPALRLHVG